MFFCAAFSRLGMWVKNMSIHISISLFLYCLDSLHIQNLCHISLLLIQLESACISCPGSTLHPDSSYLEHNWSCWEQDAPLLLPLSDVTQILHNDSVRLCSVSLSLLPSSFLWYQPLLRAFSQEDITFAADQAIMRPSLEIDLYHFWLPAATALTKILNRVKKKKKKKTHLIRQASFKVTSIWVQCTEWRLWMSFVFVFSPFFCCFFTHSPIDSTRAVVVAFAKTEDNFCPLLG